MSRSHAVPCALAVLLLTACDLAAPAGPSIAAGAGAVAFAPGTDALPFEGRFEGVQSVTFTPPTATAEVSAAGVATHLGRFTLELPHTVDLTTQSAQGIATLVAANGDMLVASFTGEAQPGPVVRIVEHATITGGTGRFAGATGSFTIERIFDPGAGTTTGSFTGTLSGPGAADH